ncbi:MAG TPA: hypothetical protein VN641_09240 [Urbifossiella sp.]|nr:hypothetical protein [Urbifossiella sp.]
MMRASPQNRPGYVLVAVLIVSVVLSLAAYQFTELMTAEYRAAARSCDAVQAREAAVSGVHYAAAMLADPTTFTTELGGNPFIDGAFQPQIVRQGVGPRTQANCQLIAVAPDGNGGYVARYGAVTDEAGKLNINALILADPSGEMLAAALTALQQALQASQKPCGSLLTANAIDAIVDWVDGDDDPRTNGAESSSYQGKGFKAKNGPLNSLDELLFVQGVTPQLLYGTDRNRNGVDDEGSGSQFDRGLSDYITVYGRELNMDSLGVLRENVNASEPEDLPGLYTRLQSRVGPDLAAYIMAYRLFGGSAVQMNAATTGSGQSNNSNGPTMGSTSDADAAVQAAISAGTTQPKGRLKSLTALINTQVTLPKPAGADNNTPTIVVACPLNDPGQLPTLIGALYDAASTTVDVELAPRININTAPKEVLMALIAMSGSSASAALASSGSSAGTTAATASLASAAGAAGLQESDIDNIIAQRDGLNPGDPATTSGAWVIGAGISPTVFAAIEKYVSGRTMVYRVHSMGYFTQGGPAARVEAVIDTNQGAPRILYFRDLTDLDVPRGFTPPPPQ